MAHDDSKPSARDINPTPASLTKPKMDWVWITEEAWYSKCIVRFKVQRISIIVSINGMRMSVDVCQHAFKDIRADIGPIPARLCMDALRSS